MNLRVPLKIRVNRTFENARQLQNIATQSMDKVLVKEDLITPDSVCKTKLGRFVSHCADGGCITKKKDKLNELVINMTFDPSFYREPQDPYDPLDEESPDTYLEFDLYVMKRGQCIGNCDRGSKGLLKVKGNPNGYHDALSFGVKETGNHLAEIRRECRV